MPLTQNQTPDRDIVTRGGLTPGGYTPVRRFIRHNTLSEGKMYVGVGDTVASILYNVTATDTALSMGETIVLTVGHTVADTATAFAETVASVRSHSTADTATSFSESLVRGVAVAVADTLTAFGETVAVARGNARTAADTATAFSESIVSGRVRTLADTATSFVETLVSNRLRTAADVASSFADTLVLKVFRPVADAATAFAETIATARTHSTTDTALSFGETLVRRVTLSISDTATTFGETLVAARAFTASVTDTALSFGETLVSRRLRTLADTATTFGEALVSRVTRKMSDFAVRFGYTQIMSTTGPGSSWAFNETTGTTAADAADSRPGTYVGSVTLTDPPLFGDWLTSVFLTQGSGYITLATGFDLNSGDWTIMGWIKPTGVLNSGSGIWTVVGNTTSGTVYSPNLKNGAMNLTIQNVSHASAAGATTLVAGQVHHAAWVYVAATRTVTYVLDGVVDGTGTFTAPQVASLESQLMNVFGASNSPLRDYWGGNLSGFSYHNRALSVADEIVPMVQSKNADAVTSKRLRALTDTLSAFGETITSRRLRSLTDTATSFSETLVLKTTRFVADTATSFGETVVVVKGYARTVTDTVTAFAETVVSGRLRRVADTATAFGETLVSGRLRLLRDRAFNSSRYSTAVLTDTPSAYWRLGESSGTTATDEQATNPGTYVGSPTLAVSGAIRDDDSTGVTFNGTPQRVDVADHNSLDLGDVFSVEFWVKAATSITATLVDKGTGAYAVHIVGGAVRVDRSETTVMCTSTGSIGNDLWTHVVCTKNGATLKIWINGVDVTGTVTNATCTDNTSGLFIAAGSILSNYLTGSLDEVALYPTALSGATVLDHYQKGTQATIVSGRMRALSDTATAFSDSTAVVKRFARSVSDTATAFAESIVSGRLRTLADTATAFSEALVSRRLRSISDTASTWSDSVVKVGGAFSRSVSDTATSFAETVVLRVTRSITDTATALTDTLTTRVTRTLADTATALSDSVVRVRGYVRTAADTAMAVSDTVALRVLRNIADTALSVSEALARRVAHFLTDTASSWADSVVRAANVANRSVSDTATSFSDTVTVNFLLHRAVTDTALNLTDGVATRRTRTLTDTAFFPADSLTVLVGRSRSLTDTATGFGESISTRRTRTILDTALTVTDAVAVFYVSGVTKLTAVSTVYRLPFPASSVTTMRPEASELYQTRLAASKVTATRPESDAAETPEPASTLRRY